MHNFHVSLTQIDYNGATGSLEVSMKIFTDDLELALEGAGAPKLHLGGAQECGDSDALIAKYLEGRFSLETAGKHLAPTFIGKELDADAVWCYLEFKGVPALADLQVTHRVLTEVYADQSNMVHLDVRGKRTTLVLDKNQPTMRVEF